MYGPPYVCPTCRSKFKDIRAMIFPEGSWEGHQCQDDWHWTGKVWDLTENDKKFLYDLKISQK